MTVSHSAHPASAINQTHNRFYVSEKAFSFHRQYSKIYAARLQAAKPRLINAVTNVWNATVSEDALPPQIPIRSLNNLVTNERCVIIGIVYKEMKKKPSVLRELASSETVRSLAKQETDTSVATSSKLFSEDDSVYLEDDMQRILLCISADYSKMSLLPTNLITGVPVALLGFEPESEPGSFRVEDVTFLEPQPDRPITARPFDTTARVDPSLAVQFRSTGPWLALVSGLEFVGTGAPKRVGHALSLQLLADWLRCAGDWTDDSTPAHQCLGIVRLMILGDSICAPRLGFSHGSSLTQQARYLTRNCEADSVAAMTRFDTWLSSLPLGPGFSDETTNGFSVDLLPGPSDPTSPLLPQQPVHASAFPITTSRHPRPSADRPGEISLCGRTNPFLCQLFGRTVLATSGQGVNDLLLYTDIADPCDRMEATLVWGHLAPSCPDTLPGYPLSGTDLLLFSTEHMTSSTPDYPDIYVAGCQPGQEPKWRRASLRWRDRKSADNGGALLISVPRFSTSRSLVLVHLDTLDCRVVRFDTDALDNGDD